MKTIISIVLISVLAFSCQKEDLIVQSLYDLSGAPLEYDDSNATKFLNIAAVSIKTSRNKDENLETVLEVIQQIMIDNPETELILFGETILGWYIDDENPGQYQKANAEPIPGPATLAISSLCDSLDVYVAFGISEKDENEIYNSQVMINPEGNIEAIHRKINLTPDDELSGFSAGEKIPENVTVICINNIKIGMIVCADVSGYWLTRELTDRKVEVILHSMASEVPEFKIDPVSRKFNALEVFANRFGTEGNRNYQGTTFISDPSGNIRVSGSGNQIIRNYKLRVR